jgi:Holliday junction resolvase RusA-like endonuclease
MTKTGHVYNPDTAREWKETIQAHFLISRKPQITVPVYLKVSFYLPRPKRLNRETGNIPHIAKPDVDNLLKSVMDALTDAGAWKDDSLVFATAADKWYARENTGARIIVKI